MEVMIEKIEKMERGFGAMIKEIKGIFEKQVEEMKKEMKEERASSETERARGREGWEREKKELLGRIRRIEEEKDRAEGEKRRRNIVIKRVDWNEGSNEGTVKEFIREKMKIGAEIERTHRIRVGDKNTIIVAMMKSMEEKIRVMKEKGKLEKRIYIDDDLTRKEREVQQQIKRIG
ncbi:probable kinetochore protein NDC80 [Bombus impatiens]|uniref:Probable kinetochore protein NDC80 n=1 Tax=Bombus impatiens TaxID=132113 RepID=A0A6P3V3Y4_BOMIM|nr:probable kinetochore protein NDC80 [Bombus impatiens]